MTHIFFVRLLKSEDPTISRILCVPADLDFSDFHLVLQAAFGWAEAHLYRFTVSEPRPAGEVCRNSRFPRNCVYHLELTFAEGA